MTDYEIASIGYGISAALFLLIGLMFLTRWRVHAALRVVALPAILMTVWALLKIDEPAVFTNAPRLVIASEVLRTLFWAAIMLQIFRNLVRGNDVQRPDKKIWATALLLLFLSGVLTWMAGNISTGQAVLFNLLFVAATLNIFLCEQIVRNLKEEYRDELRNVALTVSGIFLYDVAFYVLFVISAEGNETLNLARGYVNALFSVPIFFALSEHSESDAAEDIPSPVVINASSTLLVIGVIIALLMADLIIRSRGSTWIDVFGLLLILMVVMIACMLLVSRSFRNKARVFMMKALFRYKYDYRREWLRFIGTLSESEVEENVPKKAVRAIAQIVNSPGGAVWAQQHGDNDFHPIGSWNCDLSMNTPVDKDSELIEFLRERNWVTDLDEMRHFPQRYLPLTPDKLPLGNQEWWLVVPMMLGERLSGFLTLLPPDDVPALNFEDHDLLKTAGRHIATHIEQVEADRRLAEVSQFGAYNRLTAFLMHDLKNLIAQQSLVVKNAEIYRHNPEFVDDAIDTIAHSVSRMRKVIQQLGSVSKQPAKQRFDARAALKEAVDSSMTLQPKPSLKMCQEPLFIRADQERLTLIFEHLIRNAQDATESSGMINVSCKLIHGQIEISIEDTGIGMSREFIRERLFRPFDSTKGSESMGVGAYQARDYVQGLSGNIDVSSELGKGTVFTIRFPVDVDIVTR